MMLWLLTHTSLASDPAALRHLHGGEPFAVDIGTQGLSVAADVGPLVAVTLDPGAWFGASVGTSVALAGDDRGWGVDGTLAAGAAALLATPSVALTGTAAVRGGFRGERIHATGGAVLPAAIRVDWPIELLVPADLELVAGGRLGEVWLGARASMGAGLVPGHAPALRWGVAGWMRIARF